MTKHTKKEIDALFDKVKKPLKPVNPVKPAKSSKPANIPKGSARDPLGKGDNNSTGGPRRYTEEGWPIYTESELKLSKSGGDTAACPFDCDCCF
jgi:hypothetical protein